VIYEDLVPITREQYRHVLRVGTPADASEALLRIVHHDPDHDWAEGECCAALQDARQELRIVGAIGLAHLARTAQRLGPRALSLLRELRNAPDIGGYVEDALDDWMIFGSTNRD